MSKKNKPLSFTLFDIERSVAQRNYKKFEADLIELFSFIDNRTEIESTLHTDKNGQATCSHVGLVPFTNQLSFNEKLDLYSRLASAITTYLSDNEYVPSDDFLIRFVIYKTHITNIFYLSCYENTDHILFNRGLSETNNSLNLKTDQDIKFLYACLSLNSNIEFDVEMLVNAIPVWGMHWYLGLLYGQQYSYNQRIESNLNKIVDAHPLIQNMVFDDSAVEMSASPWMLCSYLDRSNRHNIKKSINVAIEKWINGKQLPPGILKKVSKYIDRTTTIKKVVVLSEKLTSKHAMFRCYYTRIAELKSKYHVTLVSSENDYDNLINDAVDEIVNVADTATNFIETVKAISSLEPDLIIFPSLGMAKWTITIANMRLAKYQIMTYGHPASAFSKYIDYGIVTRFPKGYDLQRFCLEKVTPFHDDFNYTHPHPELESVVHKSIEDGVTRIAINSSLMKITTKFINLCQIIQSNSSVPIEYNFFMIDHNNVAITAFQKSLQVGTTITYKVHPPASYKKYMENLSTCDLAIGTFPFGGANTNVDLMLLGIPKIYYTDESDLASFTDQINLDKLNLPSILKATSETQVLSNAIYLIHDHKERTRLSKYLKSLDMDSLFFHQKVEHSEHYYIKAINWITKQ